MDDDHTLARLLGDGLAAVGQHVEIAHSADSARAVLRARTDIGVVVSDIRMPGGDGLDLALEIAAEEDELRAASVVLITGHATIEDVARAVRTGAVDFLRKPCRLSELAAAVDKGMAKARARRGGAHRQVARDRRLADLEAERVALLAQVRAASERLCALQASGPTPRPERDILAVSHALRTPLNAIAGGAALLESRRHDGAAMAAELVLLREGVMQAVAAIELVEELHRLQGTPQDEMPPDVFALAEAARRVVARMADAALAAEIGLIPPDPVGPRARAPLARFDRATELCIGAALEVGIAGCVVEIACTSATADGAAFACMTLIVAHRGAADMPCLPPGPALPETGTPHSRTQETLRFFVARRIVEQMGGLLTSCSGPDRSFAIRLALPAAD